MGASSPAGRKELKLAHIDVGAPEDERHEFGGRQCAVAHALPRLGPDAARDEVAVEGGGQRPRQNADHFRRVPVRHDAEDGALPEKPGTRPRARGHKIGHTADTRGGNGVGPLGSRTDGAHLQKVEDIVPVEAELDVQRVRAAQGLQAARQGHEGREAGRIKVLLSGFPVDIDGLAHMGAAGHGVGLAGFVIVIDDIPGRAVGESAGHDDPGDRRFPDHGLNEHLVLGGGVAIRGDDPVHSGRKGRRVLQRHIQHGKECPGTGGLRRILTAAGGTDCHAQGTVGRKLAHRSLPHRACIGAPFRHGEGEYRGDMQVRPTGKGGKGVRLGGKTDKWSAHCERGILLRVSFRGSRSGFRAGRSQPCRNFADMRQERTDRFMAI